MTNILVSDFVIALWIFLRIVAAMFSSPVYGNEALPNLAKIMISAIIAYIVFLTIDTTNIIIQYNLLAIALVGIKEVITGLIIGFSMNIVFHGISFAGMLIGTDMQLSMASVMNPLSEDQSNVIGDLIYFMAMLIFFVIDGHHYVIRAVVASYKIVPIGKYSITEPAYQLMIKYAASVFVIAVKIASPIMVSFFLIHLAEGIIARIIPQMQVFFIMQPVSVFIGFLLIIAALPIYVLFIKNLLMNFENDLYQLIKAMGA
jgi:flagellar biosynthetic protein FliR